MNQRITLFHSLLIFLITIFVYILFAGRLSFSYPTHEANYLSHQAYSFLKGRIDLANPNWDHDLSFHNGKKYIYWGPSPVILIMPFIVLFGINFSDALYTAIISSLSPLIFYLITGELQKLKIINLSDFKRTLLALFFAFGTTHFILSINGGIWFTSQTISALYIFLAIFFLIRFKIEEIPNNYL